VAACPECGYVYEALPAGSVSATLRSFGGRYREALGAVSPVVASRRPEPDVWSALEYASHVRDVFLVQRERVVLAQVEEKPSFARMYRDERVALCGYSASTLPTVLDQLQMAAELCADTFRRVDRTGWSRVFVYNWPAADQHDVLWLGRHTVHEGEHHLLDVHGVLARTT
jgi:DinB superfamily